MKKIAFIMIIISLSLTACSEISKEEFNELQESYESEVEKNQEISEKNDELESLLKYHVYESGTPTVEGIKIENNENASNAIHNILDGLESKINGDISEIVQYESSYTFDITTEKNGMYHAMMSMNEESYPVFITIYMNSEFCYCWNGLENPLLSEEGWYIDTFSNNN